MIYTNRYVSYHTHVFIPKTYVLFKKNYSHYFVEFTRQIFIPYLVVFTPGRLIHTLCLILFTPFDCKITLMFLNGPLH